MLKIVLKNEILARHHAVILRINIPQNAIVKVNNSLQESVLMLKGFETKQESMEASRAASVERVKSRGSESKTKSETASQHGGSQHAGERKSRQGSKPGIGFDCELV